MTLREGFGKFGVTSLSVIIPTYNRRPVLLETLRRLQSQEGAPAFEVLVVDDGSTDDTASAVSAVAAESRVEIRLFEQANRGPATARNRALANARGNILLFLGDDTWPGDGFVARHASFHAARPARHHALLGRIRWAPECRLSPFMEWLENEGLQFSYDAIEAAECLSGEFFYSSNVSVKRAFLSDVGGFDEGFRDAAGEDTDLGLRLERAGMELAYDPSAIADHYHPTDLHQAVRRFWVVGRAGALLEQKSGKWPAPRRPGVRHRMRALALEAIHMTPFRPPSVQHATWRFLSHEAYREGFWADEAPVRFELQIGSRLAKLAAEDPDTHLPALGTERGA